MSWVAVGVAAVGVGVSAYSAYSAGEGSGQTMSSSGQFRDAKQYASAQSKLNKEQAKLALKMYPEFAQAQLQATDKLMTLALRRYPEFAAAERTATTEQRNTDLGDFQRNSDDWAAALDAISPSYQQLGVEAGRGGAGTPLLDYLNLQAFAAGPSDLRSTLEQQALYELQFGGALTPEEERMAAQSSRAAWSARGLVNSNPAITAEVLDRDYLARARLRERQQMGINAQQVGQSEDSANRAFATGVQAQNEAAQGNWRNFLVNASQAEINPVISAGMTRTNVNPYGLFGASNAVPSPYGMSSVFATAPQIAHGVQAVQPLYMTNFAAAESRANAQANATAALGSGLTSTGASMYTTRTY